MTVAPVPGVAATGRQPSRSRRPGRPGRLRWLGTLLTTPAWLLLLGAVAVPLAVAGYASLTDESLSSVGPAEVVGAENFSREVLHGGFWHSLRVTVIIMAASLAVQIPIGYVLARALVRPLRGRAVFRTAITLPMMLTPVAVGLMWRFLSDPDLGLTRVAASAFGDSSPVNLLASQFGALALVVGVNSWINIPFVTLILLAGLLSVDEALLESAAVDGAGWWQVERYVRLPMIAPVLGVCCVLRAAADYRMFDLVYTVTRGGPGDATLNLSMLAYQQSMVNFEIGRACAIAVAMAVLALPAYWLFTKVTRP
ncbi:carbohydrate ABC transporter permease [Micromonospora sp. NBS 11-29]|uniref:carbohydrate ABC transporter permease n=1 Tax=Micromonospora sp. NBS 11-29 TaxID=1960879 RepID=UPI000B780957|nr:sugar ABC transporter permease [Micromonospora sp. NBS 11-29]